MTPTEINAYHAGQGPGDPDLSEEDEEFGVQFNPNCTCGHELNLHDLYVKDKPCQHPLCKCNKFREES